MKGLIIYTQAPGKVLSYRLSNNIFSTTITFFHEFIPSFHATFYPPEPTLEEMLYYCHRLLFECIQHVLRA
jgi:hypothetical protein